MMISFNACGHSNIKAAHKSTIEFTKDTHLTPKGDCILGINSDFNLKEIKGFIKGKNKLTMKITAGNVSDTLEFIPNQKFNDSREIVIRLGEYASERTLGTRATKAARHIKRELVEKLKQDRTRITISISCSLEQN